MASSSMLYDTTLCAACGKKGAHSRCMRCLQAAYCDRKCQKVHWRAGHKRECKKVTTATATATAKRATHTAAARQPDQPCTNSCATSNESSAHAADGDQENDEHECPICLDHPDTFMAGPDEHGGQCFQCGQLFCGPCKKQLVAADGGECPTCRATLRVSKEEIFRQLHALVHTRSPGRHTPFAQFNLGNMYRSGVGVDQDSNEAARLYTLAAAQGNDANAQYNLRVMYNASTGVAKDSREAVRLYALAAAQGDFRAQCNLGTMYENGTGVAKDSQEAVRLFALAAAQGVANAQGKLGSMHAKGQGGLVRDFAEAAAWFRLAAAQGNANAQSALDCLATLPINQPGMRVQVVGLTSANGLAINGREGLVQDQTTKPGRAAVLLDGDTEPTSINITNLRKAAASDACHAHTHSAAARQSPPHKKA